MQSSSLNQPYWMLKVTFGAVPIVAGLDKFTNLLTNWEQYLSPIVSQIIPAGIFMRAVGIIEIVAGHRPDRDEPPEPGPVADRIAWLVTFMMDPWTTEFAVDDRTGAILRFRRSRDAALAGIGGSRGRA